MLNAGGGGSISGFRIAPDGTLSRLSDSDRSINANQDPVRPDTLFNPAQISFAPNGKQLLVSIKDGPAAGDISGVTPTGPGRILVFGVDSNGRVSKTFRQTNLGNDGPFGFSFDRKGRLITSLFIGGPNLTGAAGSFKINSNGSLSPISRSVGNTQLDSCWVENDGSYAWTANYSSGTISSYKIGTDGSLRLLQAVAGTTNDLPGTTNDPAGTSGKVQGSTPLDILVSPGKEFLYDVLPGSGAVAAWKINRATGALTKVGEFGGLPDTVNGDNAPIEFGPGGSPAGIAAVDFKGDAPGPKNVVYVMSNDPRTGRNSIIGYRRNPTTGALTQFGVFNTGGTGYENVNDRIGPDDSDQEIVVSRDRRFLYAVNQGSGSVSTFSIAKDGSLTLVGSPVDSGGLQPVSIGLRGDIMIVANKGDQDPGGTGGTHAPNYTSFRVNDNGTIKKIRGSTIEVGPGSSPSQALVSTSGQFVFGDNFLARPIPELFPGSSAIVPAYGSELESFRVGADGRLTPAMDEALPSQLPDTPDKYILNMQNHPTRNIIYAGFVVGNKLGVYTYDSKGVLTFQKAISLTGQGLCWIAVSKDGKRLYGTNFSSDSVSVVDISDPLNPVEIQDIKLGGPHTPHPATPPSPAQFNTVAFQLSLSPDGKFLYTLNHEQSPDNTYPEGNQVNIFKVEADGRLSQASDGFVVLPQETVPANAHPQGIVAL